MSRLTIQGSGVTAKVELDGADISNALRGLSLNMAAGSITRAVLDVPVIELDAALDDAADGKVQVFIPAAARDLLVQLGWTPPEGCEV